MSEPAVPARTGGAVPVATDEPRKLDDVMLAMDVVDTLRYRERIVDMELNESAREEQLIARLKEIYGAQGIEVPDKILKDGVKALAEQRFVYKPPRETFSVKLAKLYVSRKKWLPAAMTFTGAIVALVVGWQVFWAIPQANAWNAMPGEIARLSAEGQALAIDPAVDGRIQAIERAGVRAIGERNQGEAQTQVNALKDINEQLALEYDLRIVTRPGERTGVFFSSEDNPLAVNYYIIVEGVAPGGRVLTLPIRNEQTGKTERVDKWGQRVSKETFDRIASEKAAGGGIITNDTLGTKTRGQLEPTFDAPVPGGTITQWNDG